MTPAHKPAMEPAEKLWELLRRNPRFRRVAAKMVGWAQNVAANRDKGFALLSRLEGRPGKPGNLIAAEVLRWLAPDPWFVIEEEDQQEIVTRLGIGITPDPDGGQGWRWFDRGPDGKRDPWRMANVTGLPHRWGPKIRTPKRIAEWRLPFEFTVDTPWKGAPDGFKVCLRGQWSAQPGITTKVMRARHLERPGRLDSRTVAGLARTLEYLKMTSHFLLAVPRPRVLADVDAILKGVKVKLLKEAKRRSFEVMGTPKCWEDFLAVDEYRQGNRSRTGNAIRRIIMERYVLVTAKRDAAKQPGNPIAAVERWFRDGRLEPAPDRKQESEQFDAWFRAKGIVRSAIVSELDIRRHDLRRRTKFMDALIDATFPRFDFRQLLKPSPQ